MLAIILLSLATTLPAGMSSRSATSLDRTAANAQTTRGVAVTGVVQDQTGAVLPGASVDLVPPGTTTPAQTVLSDGGGVFRFERVPPGAYDIHVSFPGFKTTVAHVRVTGRAPGATTIVMPIEGVTQELSVTSGGSGEVAADAAKNLNAISVDANTVDNLPVLDQDIVGTMSRFLDLNAIGTNGPTILVDGIEVNALAVSASAVQQIKINQDPYSAEFMRPGRGRIEIVTKPGGRDYTGTLNFRFRDSDLNARNAFAASKPPEQRRIVEGTLGGPVPNTRKTSFLLSASYDSESNQSIVFADTPGGVYRASVPTPFSNLLAAATWNHQHGDKYTYSMRFSHLDRRNTSQGVGGTTLPEAGYNHDDREDEMTFTQQTLLSPRLLNDVKFLFGVEREPRTSVSPLPHIVVLDAFNGGGAQNDSLRTEHHFTLVEALTWSPKNHVLKFGINIPDWSWRGYVDRTNSGGTFSFSSLDDYAAGRPFSFVQQVGNGQTAFLEKVVGLFVQDEMHPAPNLSIAAGLRYDWQNVFHDDNNVAPRMSFAYAPGAGGRTVIRGGAGVFYDRTGPGPIQDLIRYDGHRLLRYVLINPGYPNPLLPGETLGTQPPSIVRLAPDVTIPFTAQYSVGIERELHPKTTLAFNVIGTRGHDVFRSRDVNAPSPPDFLVRPNPDFGVIRQIESAGTRRGIMGEVTLHTQTAHLTGTIQYSEGRASDNTSGIYWMPPNSYDLSGEYGPADWQRKHALELFGTATAGRWLNFGASFEAYSGRPYSLTTGRDDFNTGTANARPAGVSRNSLTGPGLADLDLRWWREFAVPTPNGRKYTATVGIDAFNVLNHVNYTSYIGNLSSPFFGQAVAAEAARRIQLSLRIRY